MSEIRVDKISEKTADAGITLKSQGTADNKPMVLTLQTAETDMAANDVIGKIAFQAPDEGTGTDAILVAAAIQARSEGDFSSSANATAIDFMVGASEAAATKMSLSSGGVLTAVELDISGNIDVDGTTNLDVVDIDGAVNMATTALVTGVLTTTAATVFNGGFASNAGSTINISDNSDALTLKTTDADANIGPILLFNRDSSSPADNDFLGAIDFQGDNDAGETHDYIRILSRALDVSNGAEKADLIFKDATGNNIVNFAHTEVAYNDDSVDRDFRVESNGKAHMFFVDGGANRVGIGTAPDLGAGLHIRTADSGASVSGDADELVLENSRAGMSFLSATDNYGIINFGDSGDNNIGQILYFHGDNSLSFVNNNSTAFTSNSSLYVEFKNAIGCNETDPDISTGGLCLNQGAEDDAILTFKSSDVAHGMTAIGIQTDTYAKFLKNSAADGGLRIISLSDSNIAFKHEAFGTGENTAESNAATSNWSVDARKKNGTSVAGLGTDDNLASFRTSDESMVIIKGNGEIFSNQSATVGTFDAYEDAQLVRAFDLNHMQGVINSKFDKFVQYNKDDLQKARLIGTDDDGNATPFVSLTGMSRLHNGAIWQQYEKTQKLTNAFYKLATKTIGKEEADKLLTEEEIKLLN